VSNSQALSSISQVVQSRILYESPQAHNQNIYNLFAGLYELIEKVDKNNCELNDPVNHGYYAVSNEQPIFMSVDKKTYGDYNISCNGASDGWIEIVNAQGNGHFEDWDYKWTYPDGRIVYDSLRINSLESGLYILDLVDTAGCEFTEEFNLIEPDIIRFDSVNTSVYGGLYNISCLDSADGAIKLYTSTNGRTGRTYNYEWDGPPDAVLNPDLKGSVWLFKRYSHYPY